MPVQTFGDSVGSTKHTETEHLSHIAILPYTKVDKIPTKQRVVELLKEKKWSNEQLGMKIGMNRTTIRTMLMLKEDGNRKREIYGYELEKIMSALNISYDRFIQKDIVSTTNEFKKEMKNQNYERALELAKELHSVSRGLSEQCRALNDLGRVYYYLKDYDAAHNCWLQAKEYAEEINKQFGDPEKLYKVLRNLLTSYDTRKEYSHADEIIQKVQSIFANNPERSGVINYYSASIAYNSGDMEKYRDKMYEALECFLKTENKRSIGKAQHNIGFIEYQAGNYQSSKEFYENALLSLENEIEPKIITVKDLAKTLLCLNLEQETIELLETYIPFAIQHELSDLAAKLYILLASVKDELDHAITALSIEKAEAETRLLACKLIMNIYANRNDSTSLLRYYKIEQTLLGDSPVYKKEEM